MGESSKRTSRFTGQAAETLAVSFLMQAGYIIVARNYRIPEGEIDIIAREDGCLCMIEVRYRADAEHGHPLETVGRRKIWRIVKAARCYLATYHADEAIQVRFDVLGIVGGLDNPEITLVREAFEVE